MNIITFLTTIFIYAQLIILAASQSGIESGKDYNIVSVLSGKYVTAASNGNVQQYEKLNNDKSQIWRLESAGNGRFAILQGNMAMTVENGNNNNGNNIYMSEYRKTTAQHFSINRADNSYYIVAQCTVNAALDVFDQSKENGANIDQWDYWGGDNQKFYIFPAGQDGPSNGSTNGSNGAYLFAFFQGNAPEKEQLSYALSTDGYHFNILNNGNSIWKSSVGTGCLRDPFILKGEDGTYFLLATDMRSYSGWDSNRNILTARSTDLIHWTNVSLIEVCNKYPIFQRGDRAWAPQAIYDPEKQAYMIYFAVRVPSNGNKTIMYYAHSKDMTRFDTTPQLLFAPKNGNEAIDADIIYQGGRYYMYYKDETRKTINLALAEHASGPYQEIKQLSDNGIEVEGCNIYPVVGTNKWLMMSDAYVNGYFVLQETTDLVNFRTLNRNTYGFNFTPRHGYVIPVSPSQYNALLKAYPSRGMYTINVPTTTTTVKKTTTTTAPVNTSGAVNEIPYSYPYCKTTKDVAFDDGTLQWGVENDNWCIIKGQSAQKCNCWAQKLGYPCCTEKVIYYSDGDGDWGFENNQWCGIMKC
ncbi:hypothetical protein BCR32DRAFT_324987 [Anaeromyces robustus]|jgi:hypothetical protein|uniref:Endo-1,5-alpha-L-arabinanase A n=1 Tax=Anaeromyces robustus TaxID=1754192 RepID=A0A1Y1XL84_9FUNG|nr:hypothetical protein BCR32DRAFT_324987 [Anaeromyces robustus]|eukprot:ORX86472.1 hypothetical protein BCR32DRAFT_324987 [Anaeromyces robustus]